MSDYIKREDVYDQLDRWARDLNNPQVYQRADARCVIDGIPSADVAPVRHGRWIDDKRYVDGYYSNCSECGWQLDVKEERWYHNYCPNCGAKMDEEE